MSSAHRAMMIEYDAWVESWELQWESATHGEPYTKDRLDFYELPERPTFKAFLIGRSQRELK